MRRQSVVTVEYNKGATLLLAFCALQLIAWYG